MGLNFQECWQRACGRARVDSSNTSVAATAQSLVNDYYEDLVNLCPEAPWARKAYRFTTQPSLSGTTASWVADSTTVTLGAGEALTAAQQTAYVGGYIYNPAHSSVYRVTAIPSGTQITLDLAYIGETTDAGAGSWTLFVDLYDVPADYSDFVVLSPPDGGSALPFKGEVELREHLALHGVPGTPQSWSLVYDGSSMPRLILDPPPSEVGIYTLVYIVKVTRLTGTEIFTLLPDEGVQAVLFLAASDLAAMLREDAQLATFLRSIGQPKWDKLVNKYAPQRAHPRFKLPASARPFQPRTARMLGSHVADANEWARRNG